MRLLGCALVNSDGCHYKKRILGHRHTLKEKPHDESRRRHTVQTKERRPRRSQSCQHLDEDVDLDCDKLNFFSFSHIVCGILYGSHSRLTFMTLKMLNSTMISKY